jgi:hypothetical protein
MNRQRNRRSFVSVRRARRTGSARAASQLSCIGRRPPASPAEEAAALAFLSEILIGDSAWSMAEVRHLISMRESAGLGRWRAAEPDDGASAP